MIVLKFKRHDTLPTVRAVIKYSDTKELIDFGTHATSWFHLKQDQDNLLYLASLATIIGQYGTVEYNWNPGDLGTIGDFWGEFQFIMTDGTLTAPTEHSLKIQVLEDYDNEE